MVLATLVWLSVQTRVVMRGALRRPQLAVGWGAATLVLGTFLSLTDYIVGMRGVERILLNASFAAVASAVAIGLSVLMASGRAWTRWKSTARFLALLLLDVLVALATAYLWL